MRRAQPGGLVTGKSSVSQGRMVLVSAFGELKQKLAVMVWTTNPYDSTWRGLTHVTWSIVSSLAFARPKTE